MTNFTFHVNGHRETVNTEPVERLSNVLRNQLRLTGTKVGCDAGDCGACTVLIGGRPVCACMVPAAQAAEQEILTVEGLTENGTLNSLQKAFLYFGAAQCGICTPGMLMTATHLLENNPNPKTDEICHALGGVLCRCTGYRKIIEAILHIDDVDKANIVEPKANMAVGARVVKVDGHEIVSGKMQYGADQSPENALWLRVIRSPHWNAEFTLGNFEPTKKKHPGLVDILTSDDVPGLNGFGIYPDMKDQPVLAKAKIRYRGEAILALVGDNETVNGIRDEELPVKWIAAQPLQGFEASLKVGAPQLHDDKPGNILADGYTSKGNTEHGFRNSDAISEDNFETGFVEHAYIEPEAGWAKRIGDRLEITVSTQTPYMDRDEIASIIGIPWQNVRVIPTACGGGFGGKLDISVQPLLAIAAWKLKKPVRCTYNRIESMASSTKRHPSKITGRYGCSQEGKLQAYEFNGIFNTGAYVSWGLTVKDRVPIHATGPYFVPNIIAKSRAIFTNETPAGAFRGFGVPQAAIAHEALIDMLAEKINMDPLEFRYLNVIRKGQETATGQKLESAGLDQCLDALREDWYLWRSDSEKHNLGNAIKKRGVGIGCMWYGCGNTSLANPSTMQIGISPEGNVTLYSGAQDIGQGTNTTMMQAAADGLGIAIRNLKLVWGDTDRTPDSGKSSASRQAYVSGNAAKLAGEDLRQKILRLANVSQKASIKFSNNLLLVRDGETIHQIDLLSLPKGENGDVLEGEGFFDPITEPLDANGQGKPYGTYGFAAQIAELEGDQMLGTVKVLRMSAAHDVGRALNPQQVEGQIHGGIAQGLGFALMEEYIPGKTENLHDYLIPTMGDIPEIKTYIIEDKEPTGPWGAKGIGEPALCATAPAIFGAIYHATGVRVQRTPCTPSRLRQSINQINGDKFDSI